MKLKYRVTLEAAERAMLEQMIGRDKAAARKILYARILLKVDRGPLGPAWSDEQTAVALEVAPNTVLSIKRIFVEEGLERVFQPQTRPNRQYRKLDGAQEARLIALACGAPPEGCSQWTMKLLADALVKLNVVDSISDECVRSTLKKTNLNLGKKNNGSCRPSRARSSFAKWKKCSTCTSDPMIPSGPKSAWMKPQNNS